MKELHKAPRDMGSRGTECMNAHHLRRYRICSSPSSRSQCRLEFQPFFSTSESGPSADLPMSTSSSCSVMLIGFMRKMRAADVVKGDAEGEVHADQSGLFYILHSPRHTSASIQCVEGALGQFSLSRPTFTNSSGDLARVIHRSSRLNHSTSSNYLVIDSAAEFHSRYFRFKLIHGCYLSIYPSIPFLLSQVHVIISMQMQMQLLSIIYISLP
jgi:hypothetical protein